MNISIFIYLFIYILLDLFPLLSLSIYIYKERSISMREHIYLSENSVDINNGTW